MEAMVMGLPVIATRVGGVETLVENEINGLTVQAGDPDKLSKAIIRLLNDREMRTHLGEAAKQSIHTRYSADRMCQDYLTLFEIHGQEITSRIIDDKTILKKNGGKKTKTNGSPLVFNFHQRVQVLVEADHPQDRAFFEGEYRYHQVQTLNDQLPTLRLHLRRGGLFFASRPAGFTHYRHKFLANWSYKINISDEDIEIEAQASQLAVPMVHHMLVHPGLRWLSARQGLLLLHAGAVVRDGLSLIMTGKGGSGKTTTTSILLLEGKGSWQPHADDYVFLAKSKDLGPDQSQAYMTRSHLYRDLLHWVPEIGKRLSLYERVRLVFFGLARKWSHDGLKWPVRLPVDRLWPDLKVANSANLAGFVLLSRSNDEVNPCLDLVKTDPSLVEDLLDMNFLEARHFLKLVFISDSRTDFDDWLAEWKGWESNILREILERVPAYQLNLPVKNKLDPVNRRRVYDLFEKLLEEQPHRVF
jgi:hypothetical protein